MDGWIPMPNGCGALPAPGVEVALHDDETPQSRRMQGRRGEATGRGDVMQVPNQCMRCSIM